MIEIIRISEKGKQQLVQLKRKTGIDNWNTLCRWAFCASLAEPTIPPEEEVISSSNIEMTWKTFTGPHEVIYETLLKQRLVDDRLPQNDKEYWFKIHLHRGLSYLSKDLTSISNFYTII